MSFDLPRRRVLAGSAALAAVLDLAIAQPARAARERITVRVNRDIQNLDPANRIGSVEGNIIRACARRLVTFTAGSFDHELDAAAEIKQPSDTVIEFTLKPGIMFGGGYGEMTADDVKFSYERFNQPGPNGKAATYAKDWAALDHVEVTGTYTGRLMLKSAAPQLWLIGLTDVSGSIISRKASEALGAKIATTLIGTGPYQVAEWTPNQRLILRADPNYVGPKPGFNEVVIRPIADPKTAELAFRNGELDFTDIDPSSIELLQKEPNTTVIKKNSINYVWLGMNVEKKPYDDIKVRQAIRLGIDVDEVILAAYNGAVGRANALMAPGVLGYWEGAPVIKRDVAAAKKLLADAGKGSGFGTRLTFLNRASYQAAALVIQAQLQEIGVNVDLQPLDAATYYASGKGDAGKNLELSLQRFGGKADPSFQTQWFVSGQVGEWNWQRWANPQFDALDAKGQTTSDPGERTKIYIDAQKLMEDSAAYVWLTHELAIFAAKSWLKPVTLPNGDDMQYNRFTEA